MTVVALALTVIAEIEPLGGVNANALLHAAVPWLGSVLPLAAGAISIAWTAFVLLGIPSSSRST